MDLHQMTDEERAEAIQSVVEEVMNAEEVLPKADALPQIAAMTGAYYRALLSKGLPDALCRDLVLQWHGLLWASSLARSKI